MMAVDQGLGGKQGVWDRHFNFAFLDEGVKREIRRALVKAVCLPGHQIPFASRELPIARGWGTGGLQITMAMLGKDDVLKVIDQGCDGSVNAVNLRRLLQRTTGVKTVTKTQEATLIQTRHRVPETPLKKGQIMIYQVPQPEPLRRVEPSELATRRMHGEKDYAKIWVHLYEDISRHGASTAGAGHPVRVKGHYIMSPSPIPKHDLAKLNQSPCLHLFGAGREKRIYAVPPWTDVQPLAFNDVPFMTESFRDENGDTQPCARCGCLVSYKDEILDQDGKGASFVCSDTDWCDSKLAGGR